MSRWDAVRVGEVNVGVRCLVSSWPGWDLVTEGGCA